MTASVRLTTSYVPYNHRIGKFLVLIYSALIFLPIAVNADSGLPSRSVGINLTEVTDYTGQYPFIDLMKQSRKWRDPASKQHEFHVDRDDWVTQLKPGQVAATVFLAVPDKSAVVYRNAWVLYDGVGTIEYEWRAHKIPEKSRPGRDYIGLNSGNHRLVITKTDPSNPIRNIRIIPEPLLEAYNSGGIFNPDWLAKISPFYSIRYMDWMRTNNSNQQQWTNRPLLSHRSWAPAGVPIEIIAKLSNETGTQPWINIPHKANQQYITGMADVFYSHLNPSLKVYVEHSNEIWNWQFKQANWADKTGQAHVGKDSGARMQWHGYRTVTACNEFRNKLPGRVLCVLGVQTNWHGLEKHALNCPAYKQKIGSTCAKAGIDYIGITGYFGAGLNGPRRNDKKQEQKTADLLSLIARSAEKDFKPAFDQIEFGSELNHYDSSGIYDGLIDSFKYWRKVSSDTGLPLVGYEGGQHITANAKPLQENKQVQAFHKAINRHPRMGEVYKKYLDTWKEQGGQLFMHYTDVYTPSKWGSWGALEHTGQTTAPKWQALKEFSLSNECWWEGCKN